MSWKEYEVHVRTYGSDIKNMRMALIMAKMTTQH